MAGEYIVFILFCQALFLFIVKRLGGIFIDYLLMIIFNFRHKKGSGGNPEPCGHIK